MNEKSREQETESRPEDAQASEQVKAVSGTSTVTKFIGTINTKYTVEIKKIKPSGTKDSSKTYVAVINGKLVSIKYSYHYDEESRETIEYYTDENGVLHEINQIDEVYTVDCR